MEYILQLSFLNALHVLWSLIKTCVLQTILHIINAEYCMLLSGYYLANFTLQHKVKSSLQTVYNKTLIHAEMFSHVFL